MAILDHLNVGSGAYELADAQARADIVELKKVKVWIGVTTTELTDHSTVNPIVINGDNVTAVAGNVAQYDDNEFIFSGSAWQLLGGSYSDLGNLAYQDSASGNFTPQGTVSKPSVSVTETTTSVPNITSVGTLPTFTVDGTTLVINAGTLPTLGTAIEVVNGVSAELDNAPTFTGTQGTVTVQ